MFLTKIALNKQALTIVMLIIIIISGIASYFTLPRNEDPGFVIRTATVTSSFPGASPDRVENLVTDKIEEVVKEIPELDYIESVSRTGVSTVYVNIKEEYKHMRPIWDALRRKIEKVLFFLPKEITDLIVNDEFGDVYGSIIVIEGQEYDYAQLKSIADDVKDEILKIPEVAKVDIYGAQDERIFIEFTNPKLTELRISAEKLKNIIQQTNIIIPGGDIKVQNNRIYMEPSGNFESIDEIKKTLISLPDSNDFIYLEDIVDVKRSYIDPPVIKTRYNGKSALMLAVSMKKRGNIIKLGKELENLVNSLQKVYPYGINFYIPIFQPDDVQKKIREFIFNLSQSVIVVITVMMVALGIRTGFIAASLIPVSILLSFLFMHWFRVGLDQMSLASLIIALGLLVDNSIVISESIIVHVQSGESIYNASLDSTKELFVPLLTSTLTTSAAFLPIYLAQSQVGEYTAPIFIVVSITLFSSWFLSLTMTPFLCLKFLNIDSNTQNLNVCDFEFCRHYAKLLNYALKHPYKLILLMSFLFLFSIYIFRFVPNIFMPLSDKAKFMIEIELPEETAIETTEKTVTQLEEYLKNTFMVDEKRKQGILNWSVFIGSGAPRFVLTYTPASIDPKYAIFIVNTSNYQIIPDMMKKIRDHVYNNFSDLRIKTKLVQLGASYEAPIEVEISGKSIDKLYEISSKAKSHLASIPGTYNITDDWGPPGKKFVININKARILRAHITNEDIAVSMLASLSGYDISEYREEDKIIPIVLRATENYRVNLDDIKSISVFSQETGDSVPLAQLADITPVWQPTQIFRIDSTKTITVQSELEEGATASEVINKMVPWLEKEQKDWVVGYNWKLRGEADSAKRGINSIKDKLGIAALIIILVLVAQFNSFRKSMIIILTIPLGIIGVIGGLLVTKSYFGFMTLLGMVSLSGIVINNAVVLLEKIKFEISVCGQSPHDAIIIAAQKRIRPILLTTVTTILGLIPLWIGGGPIWEPMAISIIFGLAFATVLTLLCVPVLYSIFFKVKF